MTNSLQHLLDKMSLIKLRQGILQEEDNFNIFRILREGHEEVSVHSRFLFELLNPKGSHGMGDVFLQHFFRICELPTLSADTVSVFRERANIDLLIQDNTKAIVIENKIYAGDQHEQLKRYFEHIKNSFRQPILLYLTLYGTAPSSQSITDVTDDVKLISYKKEISRWIAVCINEAARKPILRETLIQYNTLINQLTGNSMSEAEKQSVLALMTQGDNAEQAAIIARNWNHVRWHTEWDFWTELAALVETKFMLSESSFSEDAISKHVHGGQNKDYYYGIEFSVGQLFGNEVVFKIERGEEPMYYGFLYGTSDEAVQTRMRLCLEPLDTAATKWWAGYKNTKTGIDFNDFNAPATLQLANPMKRQQIVGELWQEIQLLVSKSTEAFQREFGTHFIVSNAEHSIV